MKSLIPKRRIPFTLTHLCRSCRITGFAYLQSRYEIQTNDPLQREKNPWCYAGADWYPTIGFRLTRRTCD